MRVVEWLEALPGDTGNCREYGRSQSKGQRRESPLAKDITAYRVYSPEWFSVCQRSIKTVLNGLRRLSKS